MPRYIDIGANMTDAMFRGVYREKQKHDDDLDAVLERGWKVGLDKVMVTAGCLADIVEAKTLCEKDDRLFTTVGVHPTRCGEFEAEGGDPTAYLAQLEAHIESGGSKVVAIGECGLDYDRLEFCDKEHPNPDPPPCNTQASPALGWQETQRKYFEWHFGLAERFRLPMFLHNRNTGGDFVAMVKEHRARFSTGVVHSFDGGLEEMRELVAMGLYIGINGCSLKTEENLAVVAEVPLDALMIETDAPWCDIRPTHASHRHTQTKFDVVNKPEKWVDGKGVKGRNEPQQIVLVLEAICGVKGIGLEEAAAAIYTNTAKVFFPEERA